MFVVMLVYFQLSRSLICNLCLDDERSSKEQDGLATLCISDVDTTLHYVNQWVQRSGFRFLRYVM